VITKGADTKMKSRRIFRKSSVVIVAAVLFCLTTVTVFAASGELGHFLSRFVNANFVEFAIPPQSPAYAEDQGIKIEAAGAQQIGPVVLLYITMQDVGLTQD